ncbi:hypothetical protein BD289DRAFT_422715 [Coniella lustricola]|uniref:Mid2 domain-containing protein n=1 Tax=Coniella lustricola TaxID=2025994 RepID=A0A2T3AKH9_9PEZI|nr:hypothetical protein BD289DRAFT_422715 [Coniella lustricola]
MISPNIFLELPRPTALLLFSSLVSLASAHIARQTPATLPHRPLNVSPYPPLPAPTSAPLTLDALHELLRRQDTVCGYIEGNPALPATCSAGSHCVVDADHGVVGCCPDGQGTCTAGVYTGCVDGNSGPQTAIDPYIFTCTGSNVCYKNEFEGGYSQFGCGTASSLAATVLNSASGISSVVSLTSEAISFTQDTSPLATTTTLGSGRWTLTGDSSSTGSMTTLTIAVSSTSDASPTQNSATTQSSSTSISTSAAAPPASQNDNKGSNHTGAIVGGTIGGLAALVAIVAIAAYLWRRRAGNARQGPGPRPGDTQYISPMAGGTAAFAPLQQDTGPYKGHTTATTVNGKTIRHVPGSTNSIWQYGGDTQFLEHNATGVNAAAADFAAVGSGAGAAAAGVGVATTGDTYHNGQYANLHDGPSEDQIPLWQQFPEIDDFSRNFNDALSRIGEEDEDDLENDVNNGGMTNSRQRGSTGDLGESSPLWLQSRRQSRNLMWT